LAGKKPGVFCFIFMAKLLIAQEHLAGTYQRATGTTYYNASTGARVLIGIRKTYGGFKTSKFLLYIDSHSTRHYISALFQHTTLPPGGYLMEYNGTRYTLAINEVCLSITIGKRLHFGYTFNS
jgi:hypothetical protein